MSKPWRGMMAIVVTPFTRTYELDERALKPAWFCIDAGATGLVGPANASEFSTLSDDERRRWIDIVVGEADGQVPVVASVTSGHALPAVALSCYAQRWEQRVLCLCHRIFCTRIPMGAMPFMKPSTQQWTFPYVCRTSTIQSEPPWDPSF